MLSIGLMGAGRIGRVHSAVLASGVVKGARLAGVCDIRYERAQRVAAQHRVPAYRNVDEMLRTCSELDAVAVLTESGNHVAHALHVLGTSRHVVIEKPASLTVEGVDALIENETANNRAAVVHQNRFNPAIVALRELIASGGLGKVVLVSGSVIWGRSREYYGDDPWRGTKTFDGGALSNQGVHHLDLLLHLFGPVADVQATVRRNLHDIECEDTVSALFDFESGVQGVLQVTTAAAADHEGSLTVTGTGGYVRIGGECLNRVERWDTDSPEPVLSSGEEYGELGIPSLYGFGHVAFYQDFLDSIAKARAFHCTLTEARETIELLNRVYASTAANGAETGT